VVPAPPSLSGRPCRPRSFDSPIDGKSYSNASDTGSGALIRRSLPKPALRSSFTQALIASLRAPPGCVVSPILNGALSCG